MNKHLHFCVSGVRVVGAGNTALTWVLSLFSEIYSKVVAVLMDEKGWTCQTVGGDNVYRILTGKT